MPPPIADIVIVVFASAAVSWYWCRWRAKLRSTLLLPSAADARNGRERAGSRGMLGKEAAAASFWFTAGLDDGNSVDDDDDDDDDDDEGRVEAVVAALLLAREIVSCPVVIVA